MPLSEGYKVLALKLQEAAMQSDVAKRLTDAVNDYHRGTGDYGYYIDHDGDGTEGNCIYCCNGDIRSAPYELGTVGGKATQSIDFDNSTNVVPVTQYVPEADDSDHYTSMDEAFKRDKLYTGLPVYERFISKKSRDSADTSSFAGKGRSFPILKAEDVPAALHSIGRAGPGNFSSDVIRKNIKRIATAKGFALPDSLKDDDTDEAANPFLIEFRLAGVSDAVELKEAAEYPVKLISPGRGSSGYYTPDVLKRDGPQIFKTGTQMFWNHDTDSEESERPEGNLDRLAAVLTSDAQYNEAGHDGPGLYAQAKVFNGYVDKVREMGKHIGLSIRAGGTREDGAKGPDGKPGVITALRNAHSVDFVTRAGRDGKIFTESARTQKGDDMGVELAEVNRLIEAAVNPLKAENQKLKEKLSGYELRGQVAPIVTEALQTLRLPDASKRKLFEKFTGEFAANLPMKEGALDKEAIGKLVDAAALKEAEFLQELGIGVDVAAIGTRMTEAEMKKLSAVAAVKLEESMKTLVDMFVGPKIGKDGDPAVREARKVARKMFIEGRAA